MFKRWHLLPVLTILILVLILLPAQVASAAELCGAWDTISVMGGEYIVMNNVWGATTAQCINVPSTSSNAFTVTRADHNQGSVASYPSVIKGCHWDLCTTNSKMPIRVSDINTAPFSWSTNRISSGAWNTAPEAWFSPITDATNGYNGGAELMIWLDYMGTQPAGSQVGTATIAGANWEVWYGNIGWNYIAYRRSGLTSLSADLKPFINDSVSRGYIQNSWYLHAFEAGIELTRGGTGFVSNAFTFNINGGPNPTTPPPTTPPPTTPPATTPPVTTPPPGSVSINSGGPATGSFAADQYFSGGSTYTNTRTINMSQIPTNPPPVAVFNTERYGAMTYTIPNRSGTQTVTLYFAETYVTAAGQRVFNVTINGAAALSNFDIFASAGGADRAIARTFTTTANASNQVVIQFTAVTQSPKISGITVAGGGTPPVTTPPPTTPPATTPPVTTPPPTTPPVTTPPPTTPPVTTPPPTTPPPGGACSPVTSTITVPFTYDGAGTFCWQTSRLGSYINSWNLASLTINGVDFTNRWANSYPPAINGSWYIRYQGNFSWSHFEAR